MSRPASPAVAGILARLDALELKVQGMAKTLAEYVADLNGRMASLTSNVTAQTSVIAGVRVILEGQVAQLSALKQQLQDALAGGGDPVVLEPAIVALQAQADALAANTQALVDATVANT